MDRKISTPPLSERHPPPVVRMNAAIHPNSHVATRWADDLDDNTLPPLPPNLKRAVSCPPNEGKMNKNKKQTSETR